MAEQEEPGLDPDGGDGPELRLVLQLKKGDLGSGGERKAIEGLGDRLDEALAEADAGEFEGEELGGGQCILFFNAVDPSRTMDAVRAVLARATLGGDAYFEFEDPQPDGTRKTRRLPL